MPRGSAHADAAVAALPATAGRACPSCGGRQEIRPLYALSDIPVQSAVLVASRERALGFPKGDLDLCWCGRCGLAFNARFDPGLVEYGEGYDVSQANSPTFQRFVTDLARGWIARYGLAGRHLVEIGCGDGAFLRLICAEAGARGTGFDPAFSPGPEADPPGVSFRREAFGEAQIPLDADFVICRHTLEHIGDVAGFLGLVRRACGADRAVRLGFEVPDLRRILEEGAFWDVYYEHASYFTAGSLARAFARAGFDVLDVRRVYGDQYLVIEAAPAVGEAGPLPSVADDLDETASLVARFAEHGLARIAAWRERFGQWRASGRRVALWGSGSKAVGFLTSIGPDAAVSCVVDINPQRRGLFMPGCAAPIVAPADLSAYRPETVVIMNPIYRDEIAADLRAMDLAPEIRGVNDPDIGQPEKPSP